MSGDQMTEFSSQQRYALEAQSWSEGRVGRLVIAGGKALALMIVGGLIALLGERLIGGGGSNEVRVMPFQDWRVICPPTSQAGATCTLNSDVLRDTGGNLMSLVLNDPAVGSPLSITVPHGVQLDAGLGFSAGDGALQVRPYETCTAAGCFAFVPINADLLKNLQNNMGGQVVVALPGNTQPVAINFSLRGFKEGYVALEREKSRQGFFGFLTR
jgi:invasion protein IalB